jgi:hypothetical protein
MILIADIAEFFNCSFVINFFLSKNVFKKYWGTFDTQKIFLQEKSDISFDIAISRQNSRQWSIESKIDAKSKNPHKIQIIERNPQKNGL